VRGRSTTGSVSRTGRCEPRGQS